MVTEVPPWVQGGKLIGKLASEKPFHKKFVKSFCGRTGRRKGQGYDDDFFSTYFLQQSLGQWASQKQQVWASGQVESKYVYKIDWSCPVLSPGTQLITNTGHAPFYRPALSL